MEKFEIDFENNILPWLGRTSKVLDYYIADFFQAKGHHVTKTQLILLIRLKQFNGAAQHSLADITNRDKASLARLLTTMEKKNMVARIPCKSDKRINEIHITKNGEDVLKQTMPIMKELMGIVQEDISEEEIRTVIQVLKKVNKNINSEQFVAPLTNN
jgi:DNA-binding MarR family transcriptional regulator